MKKQKGNEGTVSTCWRTQNEKSQTITVCPDSELWLAIPSTHLTNLFFQHAIVYVTIQYASSGDN